MANIKISEATAVIALEDTDLLPVARPGDETAYKATIGQLKAEAVGGAAMLTGATFTGTVAVNDALTVADTLRVGTSEAQGGVIKVSALLGVDWLIVANQSTFSGVPEDILMIGYNPRSDPEGAGYQDPTKHKWYMALESDYWPNEETHVAEWYVQYIAAGTEDYNRRPLHSIVNLETHQMETYIRGGIRMWTSDGVAIMTWNDTATGGLFNFAGQTLGFTTNNQAIIEAARAGGGAAIEVLKIDTSDQIVMGAHVINNDDFEVTNSSNGFILKDKADGNRYRISVRNGALETAVVA